MQSRQDINQMHQDVLKLLSFDQDRDVDPKIGSLSSAQSVLGDQVIEVIMLGLSRKVSPTFSDASKLIYEWETRDPVCCFNGSVDDLLSFKNTWILAVSYKHDDRSEWNRKGDKFISKMHQQDQDTLVRAIEGLRISPKTDHVMIWCDQIMSTRRKDGQENSFGWYNAGLLPYVCLPVLTLSTHIPDKQLEKRIWIKAERSLGRLGRGLLLPTDAQLGIVGLENKQVATRRIVKQVALMILSGYWPKDTGYWSKDYEQMTIWALGVLCRADRIIEPPIFDTIKPVDNMELLAVLPELALLSEGVDFEEPHIYTNDKNFYVKASAWNLAIEKVWNNSGNALSHYMGLQMGESFRFSWWIEKKSNTIFGVFITAERATVVLAAPQNAGYNVFRKEANPRPYHHAEATASSETKALLADIANSRHMTVDLDETWHLLYSCDGRDCAPLPLQDIRDAVGEISTESDVIAPQTLLGLSTSLYRSALAKGVGTGTIASTIELFVNIFNEWNMYIRRTFKRFVSVRDTRSGPVWLEGFDDNFLTFGFLDFLTRNLITGEKRISPKMIPLRSKWEVLEEINRVSELNGHDLKVITKEIFGSASEEKVEVALDTDHIARFMLCGGFTTGMQRFQFGKFLFKSAQRRGYWRTDISARGRKLQVTFENDSGELRVLQRRTCLPEFTALGLVHPSDADRVLGISELLDDDPEVCRTRDFWKDGLEDRVDKGDILDIFEHSWKELDGDRVLCMVDMTVCLATQKSIDVCSVHDAYGGSDARESEVLNAKLRGLLEQYVMRDSEGNPIFEGVIPRTFDERSDFLLQAHEEEQEVIAQVDAVTAENLTLIREIRRDRLAENARRDSETMKTETAGAATKGNSGSSS